MHMPSDGSCQLFNNAIQAIYGNQVKPMVFVWETNDPEKPWCSQARILSAQNQQETIAILGDGHALQKQGAKDRAARVAYERLRTIYPELSSLEH